METENAPTDPIDAVLESARWAPSGDNTQPWRFEKLDELSARVRVKDTRNHCVYDLDGHATEMAAGAFLETAKIAASALGFECAWQIEDVDEADRFDMRLTLLAATAARKSPLLEAIFTRAVYRFPLSMRALSPALLSALRDTAGPNFEIVVRASLTERMALAKLNFRSARLRLTIREAWEVHRSVIEWDASFSNEMIPDRALGADPILRRVMRWGLAKWERVDFLNRYLAGTILPRLELDWLPGLCCGAHIALVAKQTPARRSDFIDAGRALQRLWLTAETHGVRMQPEMTPVIFARYAREGRNFSMAPHAGKSARAVNTLLSEDFGGEHARALVFLGRAGYGPAIKARSLRRPLEGLQCER